jgi:uncharacterized protein
MIGGLPHVLLFTQQLVNGLIELAIALVLPFLWWLCSARRQEHFAHWLGFYRPPAQRSWLTTVIVVLITLLLAIPLPLIINHGDLATSVFAQRGAAGIPAALVYAVLGTSLPEEIFFRGFLLKRLQRRFGFVVANTIQAIGFGAIHGLLFFRIGNWLVAIIITLAVVVIGYCLGWINERRSGGSIYASWGIHALLNIASSFITLFT